MKWVPYHDLQTHPCTNFCAGPSSSVCFGITWLTRSIFTLSPCTGSISIYLIALPLTYYIYIYVYLHILDLTHTYIYIHIDLHSPWNYPILKSCHLKRKLIFKAPPTCVSGRACIDGVVCSGTVKKSSMNHQHKYWMGILVSRGDFHVALQWIDGYLLETHLTLQLHIERLMCWINAPPKTILNHHDIISFTCAWVPRLMMPLRLVDHGS